MNFHGYKCNGSLIQEYLIEDFENGTKTQTSLILIFLFCFSTFCSYNSSLLQQNGYTSTQLNSIPNSDPLKKMTAYVQKHMDQNPEPGCSCLKLSQEKSTIARAQKYLTRWEITYSLTETGMGRRPLSHRSLNEKQQKTVNSHQSGEWISY